ncbi:uncharacterized protein LOC103980081 [Musa acuminata AAA Group]|uniref:uncharacterized protein LOC103980081 n=1 Tax=Musa acuminata AAA Group TaxID=214697 RepID=UPI0031DDA7BE
MSDRDNVIVSSGQELLAYGTDGDLRLHTCTKVGPGHPSNVACGVAISSCGNVTSIAYPSWLVHDDSTSLHSHCGYRGFELICRNNTPSIHLPSSNYSVTNIDYETRTISLVDVDIVFVREECPRFVQPTSSTSQPHLRSRLNSALRSLRRQPHLLLRLHRRPTGSPHPLPRLRWWKPVLCLHDRNDERVLSPSSTDVLLAYIVDDLPTRYGGVLQSGFNLSWPNVTSGDCGSCERSGGRCGLNRTINSTRDFACFCSNGVKTFHPHCAGLSVSISSYLLALF